MPTFFQTISFTALEWLALTGFTQSLLILVYIIFRVRNWGQASLALGYFGCLCLAFLFQFSLRLEDFEVPLRLASWFFWSSSIPISYLLILQIAKLTGRPEIKSLWVLPLPFIVVGLAFLAARSSSACVMGSTLLCPGFFETLYLLGLIASTLPMLALWSHDGLFSKMMEAKGGHERYWLVISLIIINVLMMGVDFLLATKSVALSDADVLRVAFGLAFVYLATTTLFRVYPQPVQLGTKNQRLTFDDLTVDEIIIAEKVKSLMSLDKLYHEPNFSRADLAQELKISEGVLSRVINTAFGKSFPQLLSEYRVEDAKRMLLNPDIAIRVAAFEVGFNSLASFNRVFREITGKSPSDWRSENCTHVR